MIRMFRLSSSPCRLTVLLGLVLAAPAALESQTAPTWAQDLLKAWYAAYNAGDVQGVARLYTEDAVVGANKGRAAYAADLTARFARVKSTCSGAFDGFQVAGASAVGWGRDECTESPKAGGPETKTRTKWIVAYARQPDGRWLTVRDEGEPLAGEPLEADAIAFMEKWSRSWVERDLDGYLALYDPSARMVFWGTYFPTIDSLRTVARSVMDSRIGETWTVEESSARLLGPALASVQWRGRGRWTERGQATGVERRAYLTALLERRGTSWKIIALHNHLSQ